MAMKKILFATDYSEASKAALPLATTLAHQNNAMLLIAHVSDREQYPVGELFDEEAEPNEEDLSALKAVIPDDPRVNYEHRLLYGKVGSTETVKPADAILRMAEKEQVGAIVLGMHGRSRLARLLMGSVAEAVVRRASCPVIIIKHPDGAPAP